MEVSSIEKPVFWLFLGAITCHEQQKKRRKLLSTNPTVKAWHGDPARALGRVQVVPEADAGGGDGVGGLGLPPVVQHWDLREEKCNCNFG